MGFHRYNLIFAALATLLLISANAVAQNSKPADDPQFASVFALWAGGKCKDAESLISRLRSEGPLSQRVTFLHGIIEQGRWGRESGRRPFQDVAGLIPDSVEGRCAQLILNITAKQNPDDQRAAMKKLVDEHADDPLIRWCWVMELAWANQDEQCIQQLEELRKFFNPGPPAYFAMYARALDGLGRHEQALTYRRKALELEPAAWSNAGVGSTLAKLRRYDEASEYYTKAIAIHPAPEHLRGLAYTLYALQKYNEAIVNLERAVRSDPSNAYGHLLWGYCLEKLGRWDEALAKYRASGELDSHYRSPFKASHDLLRQLGRDDEAEKIETQWKTNNPTIPLNPK